KAYATDRQAPFGGVIVCNRPFTAALAEVIAPIFMDVVIAPSFEEGALERLAKKKNLRLIEMRESYRKCLNDAIIRSAPGGVMVMDNDPRALGLDAMEDKVKTSRKPSSEEMEAMRFAWRVVKHVKSNAIVFTGKDRTLGI